MKSTRKIKIHLENFFFFFENFLSISEHKHRFNAVQIKMNDFMQNTVTKAIDEMSDAEFEKYREARIKELQTEMLTLDAEVNFNYGEISEEFYLFDRRERSVEITKEITKSEFQEFFHSFMDSSKQRVLCTHVIGNEKREGVETQNQNNNINIEFITESFTDEFVIKNIEAFQSDLELYPPVRSHF